MPNLIATMVGDPGYKINLVRREPHPLRVGVGLTSW